MDDLIKDTNENLKELIKMSYKFAKDHHEYCKKHCIYLHTNDCINMAALHNKSFVTCNSTYCLRYNKDHGFNVTYPDENVEFENETKQYYYEPVEYFDY